MVAIPHESVRAREFFAHAEATYLRRWTHSPATIRTLTSEPISARLKKYDEACRATFEQIPEYTACSKKDIPSDAKYVIQLTKRKYAVAYDERAVEFIHYVEALYDALLAQKSPKRRAQLLHAFPLSTVLRDIQKLKGAESSEYRYLSGLLKSTHLKLLLELGVLNKVRVDWTWPKKTFVFMPSFEEVKEVRA